MPTLLNTGTKDIPLDFAKQLTDVVNSEWENGAVMEKVTPVTQDLLKYWFYPAFCDTRNINFHKGQKQAILNAIYCHEILKTDSILSMYQQVSEGLLTPQFFNYIKDDKFNHPKYCIKMATGTGKTFVLNALLIWQYLNAKYGESSSEVKFTKNFLLVAPGLIVYERLLDAFLGKERENSSRDFETSDLKKNVDLFIPERYRQTVFGFIQNNTVKKDEIGKKVTGDGLIAVTNWHLLAGNNEEEEDTEISPFENPEKIVNDLLPITPGVTAGHDLNTIDNRYLNGDEINYLKSLPDICVFNDEAHHIHENKTNGVITEVEWQKSLNYISENKTKNFIQIDFSATPFDVTGSGQKRTRHYFSHIITDFSLEQAIKSALVKTIVIDKRKEFATIENENLDFKAVREGNNVIGLSDGQRVMIKAGLAKLKILEESFTKLDADKYPKMLIMCEDTKVSPFVCEFLMKEGLSEDDIIQIDSDKQGSVKEAEWLEIKQKLFNIDKRKNPKVIVSVLMLREGFDVNNICVIVPLRSSEAPILLEQTLGRGLRLMWRGNFYNEFRQENIKNFTQGKQPDNYVDILSVIEHPAFLTFYDDLINCGLAVVENILPDKDSILGDIIETGLKENYQDYDMYIPHIIIDKEEILTFDKLNTSNLEPLPWKLEQLKNMISNYGEECFYSEEMMRKVRFGEYKVTSTLFTATGYNDFLSKMLQEITTNLSRAGGHSSFPLMQVNQASLMQILDEYIRTKLFDKPFNPFTDNNWRVLMVAKVGIIEHILKQLSKIVYDMQNNVKIEDAVIKKEYFSQVASLKMRENFALDIKKSIYEKTQYPSNKGVFEKDFMLFADKDSEVEKLIKINENYHLFANMKYIRTDGLISSYYPDFILKIGELIYLVETKSEKDKDDINVKQKQVSAVDYCKKINELPAENRMRSIWSYSLLDDTTFYAMKDKTNTKDILEYCKITNAKINGTLF